LPDPPGRVQRLDERAVFKQADAVTDKEFPTSKARFAAF
jgi:hypothetical protein